MAIVLSSKEDSPEEALPRRISARDIGFRDPLSELTRKTRTQLLFASCFGILVQVYDLAVTQTPWLQIEVPDNAPEILSGSLSVAVAYLFAVFLVYVGMDLGRWHTSGQVHLLQSKHDILNAIRQSLYGLEANMDRFDSLDSTMKEKVKNAMHKAAEEVPTQVEELQRVSKSLSGLTRLQWFRLVVIELGAPLIVGSLAIWKTAGAVIPFVETVIL